ncbi:adenylate kinase [archaeon SCG-AAA382B04]|nr:adenylate kinase [archaeon SCG-AAA382B04]
MKVAVLTGVPGVGKTTVTEKALENIQKDYKIVNYGDKMLEVAKKRDLVEDRDQMRKLDPKTQRDIQGQAGEEISEMAENQPVIVDTHSTINTPDGYLPGLPEWVLRPLNPELIICVEADSEEIIGRRKKDSDIREREIESKEKLEEHQFMNRSATAAYSMISGATVKIIKNHDGGLEEASEELAGALA